MSTRARWAMLGVVPLALIAYFFAYPLARIVWTGLTFEGPFDISAFADAVGRADLRRAAWFTLWQAAASTVLTLVVALPGAYVLSRLDFRGARLLQTLVTIPFMLPTLVVATAFLALVGPSGAIGVDLSGTVWAILAAHVFFNYAVVVRTVGSLWRTLPVATTEVARMLGASRWRAFVTVTLPQLRPAIVAAAVITFLFTLTSFGVVLVLGGNTWATLEVEIYRQATAFLDLRSAAVLAVIQLAAVIALLVAHAWIRRHAPHAGSPSPARPRPVRGQDRLLLWGNLVVMAALLGAPLAALIVKSVRVGGDWTLRAYQAGEIAGVSLLETLGNSLTFALVAAAVATIIGTLAALAIVRGRGPITETLDVVLMLPLGTSAVTLGLGFLIALDWPFDLRGSPYLVVVAHSLIGIPFVVRSVAPVLASIGTRLREAAATMGATPSQVWRHVDLPIVGRAMAAGAGFAAAISLGEFGATAFVARPDAPTVPIAIFRLLGRPGALNFHTAMALSVVLMLLTAAIVFAIDRARAPGSRLL